MNLLGFDTSTAATSACVLRDDGAGFEFVPPVEALGEPPAHARELLPEVTGCLERAGLSFEQLDAVAVGVGPGTFTGLRIGVATARGLAHAHGLEVRPVSSLAALAEGIEAPRRLALIDAKRGELFAALYDDGRERIAPFVATPEALIERLRSDGLLSDESLLAAGDGSLRFREALEAGGVAVAEPDSTSHVVRALHLCRLAGQTFAVPADAVLPQYLREPDAKPPS
ncbi:MAG TPA: tRNA (adenosine(37)-N6)-threonylcarbamoyltransferase complex dimerization subunit type 1 TsaB [Thermoleophilaceae bacterium]